MKKADFDPKRIMDRLTLRAFERRRPLSATLELTYRCNFNCKMCYIHMTDAQAAPYGRMRTVEEWLDMAGQLKKAGVLILKLTGGECTRYPGFNELYEELARMGFQLNILSNAGSYTAEQRALFEKYPPHSVSITLYGASPETYAAVTGDAGAFERVMENIRFFRSIGVKMGFGFTMIRENVLDYPRVFEITRKMGVLLHHCTAIHSHLRNPAFSDAHASRLTPAQRVCVESNHPANVEKALKDAGELEKKLAAFELPRMSEDEIPDRTDTCVGSRTSCAFLWNGEMTPCLSLTGSKSYRPFETGFEAAWTEMQQDFEHTFKLPEACRSCALYEHCSFWCPGNCNCFTGNPHTPDPEFCKYTWLQQLYKPELTADPLPGRASTC